MALVVLVTHCTEQNKRAPLLSRTLIMLNRTVDWSKHHIVIVSNNSDPCINIWLDSFAEDIDGEFRSSRKERKVNIIYSPTNIGTARAWNLGRSMGGADEHTLKLDDDVDIYEDGWLDQMCMALERDPQLGGVSLKWRMLSECPDPSVLPPNKRAEHPIGNMERKTELRFLPRLSTDDWWSIIEYSELMSGMCALYRKEALDQIGKMYQPKTYGFDDVLMCRRLKKAGWKLAFLPTIKVDHCDNTDTAYSQWKRNLASETFDDGTWAKCEMAVAEGRYYSPDGETLVMPGC